MNGVNSIPGAVTFKVNLNESDDDALYVMEIIKLSCRFKVEAKTKMQTKSSGSEAGRSIRRTRARITFFPT